MRQIIRLLALVCGIGLMTACTDNGTGVDADLNGKWVGAFPTGGELTLTLAHSGQAVDGVGIINDSKGTGSLFASGSWVGAELELTLSFAPRDQDPEPCDASFRARLTTPDLLEGTFTDCNRRTDLSLTRDLN